MHTDETCCCFRRVLYLLQENQVITYRRFPNKFQWGLAWRFLDLGCFVQLGFSPEIQPNTNRIQAYFVDSGSTVFFIGKSTTLYDLFSFFYRNKWKLRKEIYDFLVGKNVNDFFGGKHLLFIWLNTDFIFSINVTYTLGFLHSDKLGPMVLFIE